MHAGLVTALKPGELRYLHKGQVVTLAVGSGFAEVTQTKVVVLTDMALGEAEIDELSAEEAIQRAQEKLQGVEVTAWMPNRLIVAVPGTTNSPGLWLDLE
jgi:F-type H+-transporting ATPase subunit epsilon